MESFEERLLREQQGALGRTPQTSWTAPARTSPSLSELTADLNGVQAPDGRSPEPKTRSGKLIAVGDSLGVGTTPYLKTSSSDTRIGRSSASAVDALRRLIGGGASSVLFDAGTNDANSQQLAQSIRNAVRLAGNAQIYVPTVNGPDAANKNRVIRQLGQQGLINVVDWAGASRGLVGADGIHASAQGYKRRAALIRQAMGG